MDLGATLQQAREARRVTREQLVRTTRIPLRIILAMEQDDWTKVPGGIFARGYLRAYAREVGLDGDELCARFQAETTPPPSTEAAGYSSAPQPEQEQTAAWSPRLSGDRRAFAAAALAGLLMVIYLTGRWSADAPPADLAAQAFTTMAQPTEAGRAGVPDAVGTSAAFDVPGRSSADRPRGVSAMGGASVGAAGAGATHVSPPLVVDLAVTRPCWVAGSADGARVVYRLLQPGERVQARGSVITLRVGDAGALQLSVDGQPARQVGGDGEVLTFSITRENYRSFVAPRPGN
jgi:hypothetical protein